MQGRVDRAGGATRADRGSTPERTPPECGPPPSSPQPSPPPALPPFVGLENMGETCYVNAVLQSLAACREVLMSRRGASGAASGGDRSAADRSETGECFDTPPAVRATNAADGSKLVPVETIPMNGPAATDVNPVLLALGNVLREMETSNRTLFFQQQSAAAAQQAAGTSLEEPVPAPTNWDTSACSTVRSSKISPSFYQVQLTPGIPTREGLQAGVITPTALVDLIREGCLSAERATGGSAAICTRFRREVGDPTAVADFGTGQACVSELLGKLLDLGGGAASIVPDKDGRRNGSSGVVGMRMGENGDSVCGLAKAFRGALCAGTMCMECERGRTSCEEFTELLLPPLFPSPSPNRVAAQRAPVPRNGDGLCKMPQEEAQTMQSLVDAMLGRESLEGNNKVWCEVCRQWTEAERRSSLHSPPTLLALHVRPGARKQSSPYRYPYPATRIAAGNRGFKRPTEGPGKTEQGGGADEGGNDKRELIERLLVVKNVSRCQFHDLRAVLDGNITTSGVSARQLQQLRPKHNNNLSGDQHHQVHQQTSSDSGEVFYDLIGVILHQGQNLGSGHYMFALHAVDATSRSRDQISIHHHRPPPAGGVSSAAVVVGHAASCPGETDREHSASAPVRWSGVGGEADGSIEAGSSCTKPAFVLFDDDVVRWLSPREESAILRGGGGGLGDPFLVFYARRP